MATSTLRIIGQVQGLESGPFDIDITATSSYARMDVVTCQSGNNSFTVPTNATHVLLLPPAGNTVLMTIKGTNSADDGIRMHLTKPYLRSMTAGIAASFIINTNGSVDITAIWF